MTMVIVGGVGVGMRVGGGGAAEVGASPKKV